MSKKNQVICLLFLSLFFFYQPEAKGQIGKVPPFNIVQANGKVFTAGNLAIDRPILIIYFSPECDDCLSFLSKLFRQINYFNNVSIVMITYLPISEATDLINKYHITSYRNIRVGTEEQSLVVVKYFKIESIPFAALYNKERNLICLYQKNIPINDLISKLRKSK